MTPKPTRTRGGSLGTSCDADLQAGLWQEAPFARLPPDAPPELEQYVHDIENPNRVYAIHLASRRHDFQLWVERYNLQLRVGCGQPSCTTATCFTCRKRLAGKVPIRRYNSTSARTLAVYLASQDNPQDGLCPHIRLPREAPTTSGTLIFSARSTPMSRNTFNRKATVRTSSTLPKDQSSQDSNWSSPFPYTSPPKAAPEPFLEDTRRDHAHAQVLPKASSNPAKLSISVTEKQVSKDHRSFAANLFGTVAFKMLEWLTPRGVDSMSQQIMSLDGELHAKTDTSSDPEQTASRSTSPSTQSAQAGPDVLSGAGTPGTDQSCIAGQDEDLQLPLSGKASAEPFNAVAQKQSPMPEQNSPMPVTPHHFRSTETPANHMVKDHGHHSLSPPRAKLMSQETPAKSPKTNAHVSTLGILENSSGPTILRDDPPSPCLLLQDEGLNEARKQIPDKEHQEESKIDTLQQRKDDQESIGHMDPVSLPRDCLPQSLSRLNVEIIDFICNVFQEDGTTEGPFLLKHAPEVTFPRPQNSPKALVRRGRRRPALITEQWKAFNEQTIFSVLSDPQAILQSFTSNGRLYDSHTLWYCLHRMAQVSPSLVYHSLWIAAGSLFDVPHHLQRQSKVKARRSRNKGPELSSSEAGHLMSICMHALVAAAPCAPDSRSLYEMSRIRSNGLALANGGFAARQPPPRCLDYNDAFSNELMIRLARRLFLCITSHIYTKKATRRNDSPRRSNINIDILAPLLNQLDFLGSGSTSILQFPENEKLLHETRVPTILLDWARTILLAEWNGLPDFSTDGPFAGALSFIEALHKNRNLLLLGDSQFRVDFLSDRLDSIQLPVDWLAFKSTQLRRHILDYPYIFSADTLVSFFRSINFARMSRMYEESSSLKTRMNAIVDPGSLITNPHHKTVLQDLLDTASSKYLILEIGRDNVVQGAFDQLWRREKRELLRPLKVHLGEQAGEEGFDSGGVQQEFFRLAVSECLDPTYGAFTVDEVTRMAWFSPGSLVEDWKYELVGLLVSLSVYNGLTLPVTFPKALYRKLLGNVVEELHHIADGWSDLAKGLTALLEWDEEKGSIEDVFSRTYEFSVAAFGHNVTREMSSGAEWPKAAASWEDDGPPHATNPADAPLVTSMNRDAYVSDYIRYLTDVSVRSQYLAFERGFRACLDEKSLSLLSPSTLQSLVEGIQEIDIPDLRRHTRYVGWDASHHTIRDFWSIVKKYDLSMKRRLLEFVTSSDRVPVGGMKNLQFVIQKNGEEESNGGHLPTAYTCYGTLLLPEYRNKELLKERLAMALENSQGFGFA